MELMREELNADWVNFAQASLNTRLQDTGTATTKVLHAISNIAAFLDETDELTALLAIKDDLATSEEVLRLLHEVLKHADSQSALAQFIEPLFTVLQFEDRTRQKLECLQAVLTDWLESRDEEITDEDLANQLLKHVKMKEQRVILAKYFPDFIEIEDDNDEDEIEFF